MSNSILHTTCAATLLFTLGMPGFAGTPANDAAAPDHPPFPAGVVARPVAERSGAGYRTWDLGPDPDRPGRHRYAVAIRETQAPARLRLPGRLGEAPLVWTLADGRTVEWSFDTAPMTIRQPAGEEPAGPEGRPLKARGDEDPGDAVLARAAGAGALLRFRTPAQGVRTRLALASGLVATAERVDGGRDGAISRVVVSEAATGERLLSVALPADAGEIRFAEGSSGRYQYDLLAPKTSDAVNLPPVIDAFTTPFATYGGAQGSNGAGGGTAVSGSGTFLFVDAGQLGSNHWAGYLEWDVSSIPASATVTGTWLYPIYVNYFTGAAQTVTVTDVDNGRTLTPMSTTAFDANYYNDFQSMYGGHPAYGSFTVTGVSGSTTCSGTAPYYCLELNSQAVMDLNNRLRSPNQFVVGLSAPSTTAGDFMRFTPGSSELWVYYSDFDPNQVVFSQVFPASGYSHFWLYNYGEDVDVGGWQVQSINWAGTTQTYALPASTTLKRHSGLHILDTTGTNAPGVIYTGGGVFTWAQGGASPYYVRLSLLRSAAGGGGSADYVCWGTSSPAPPAGAAWTGSCITSGITAFGGSLVRIRDSDVDASADWVNDFSRSDSSVALGTGPYGARRRSDVFINHYFTWSGYNSIGVANYGPPINLANWTLAIYSSSVGGVTQSNGHYDGTYTFPSTPLASGDVVWLGEGTAVFPTYHALDTLHQNMGSINGASSTINWASPVPGGLAILSDEGGQVRDYIVFGAMRHTGSATSETSWEGPSLPAGAGNGFNAIRNSDLSHHAASTWTTTCCAGFDAYWNSASGRGPATQGPLVVQDEIGSANAGVGYYSYAPTGFGAGAAFAVTRQAGLTEFSVQASVVNAPLSGQLVIKKQGAPSIYKSIPVTVNETGRTIVSSGVINPPLVLDPGTYAAMLYLNGNWYDAELYNDNETLTFGNSLGASVETSTTPTTALPITYPNWAAHTYLGTIAPPVITSAIPLPIGVQSISYYYAHTSSGGYGASRTWSISAGALPPGLSMNTSGAIAGTPTTPGIYDFTVKVIDGAGLYSTRDESITVNVPLGVATSALPFYDSGSPLGWSADLQPLGGAPPYSWTCSGLPTGFSCPASGALTAPGPVTAANGTYSITLQVTDGNGNIASKSLGLTVYTTMTILTNSLANGYVGIDYGNQLLSVAGGNVNGTITWALAAGYSLPAGLAVGNDYRGGFIAGTPTTAVTNFTTRLQVTNSLSGTVAKTFTITITTATVPDYWIRRGLAGGDIHQLYFSPHYAQDGVVAALAGETLYISQDRGFFWRPMKVKPQKTYDTVSGKFLSDDFFGVSFDPAFDGRPGQGNKTLVVSASASGLWLSTDFDQTWSKLNFTCNSALFFDPAVAGTAYCLAITGSPAQSLMFRTTGGLSNWAAWGNQNLISLVMSPTFATDHTFFGFDSGDPLERIKHGLYRSEDYGRHWTMLQSYGNQSGVPFDPVLSPNYATDHVVALIGSGPMNFPVMLSFDGGLSFGIQSMLNIYPVSFPPNYNVTSNRKLYGGQRISGGIQLAVSSDNGVTFSPTGTGGYAPATASSTFILSPDFVNDGTVFGLGAQSSGLYRSADSGKTWGPSDTGLYLQRIHSAAFAPDYSAGVGKSFVATADGLYYSADGGTTWKPATIPAGHDVYSLLVSPGFATDSTVYAAAYTSSGSSVLLRSVDGGLTFTNFNGSFPDVPYYADQFRITPNFATSHTLFLAGYDSVGFTPRLFKSTDYGANFAPTAVATLNHPARFGVSPGFASDQTIYLNDYSGGRLGRVSTDGGATFSTLAGAPTGDEPPAFAPNFNRIAALSGTNHTLFWNCQKSADAGGSWSNLGAYACGTLTVSPNYPTDLTFFSAHRDYTGATAEGLFKFTNGGISSVQVFPTSDPTAFDEVSQVAISPAYATDQTLMVGTSAGLYISKDGGATFTLSTGTASFSDRITAAAQDPNRAGRLYLGSQDAGVVMSSDDGQTATDISAGLVLIGTAYPTINDLMALNGGSGVTVLLAAGANGLYRVTFDANGVKQGNWSRRIAASTNMLEYDGTYVYVTRTGVGLCMLRSADLGSTWSSLCNQTNGTGVSYTSMNGPTVPWADPPSGKAGAGKLPQVANTASLWSAAAPGGARYSLDSGANWSDAFGTNDYTLPGGGGSYTMIQAMGINAASGGREVAIGHNALGVFLSRDGGATWRNVSGPGSGLELTSKNVSAFLTATTATGATDLLVGVNGTSTGGVYLSGDGGEHWTQVNQGFDPNNLSISSLVKTSCSGCPVQYYSGTYGSGVYTRTITVNPPPVLPAVNAYYFGSTGVACTVASSPTGPEQGGQPFRLCGTGFQNGLVVEFDGVPATGCTQAGGTVITCTGTPPHVPGAATIRVRNPDTRIGTLGTAYTYAAGSARPGNTLRAVKSSGDAWISWTCAGCTAGAPARLYRGQNAALSVFLETYNGGANGTLTGGCTGAAGNNSCYNQTGTVASAQSYFWTVE